MKKRILCGILAELIIHNVFTVNIGRNLNFDAKDGVEVRFEDDGTFYYDLLCEQIKKFKGQTNEG